MTTGKSSAASGKDAPRLHVFADAALPGIEEALQGIVQVSTYSGRIPDREKLQTADALIVRSLTPVDEQLLHATPVKFVATATSGCDHVDLEYLQRAGIEFASARGCNANAVAEYVLYSLCAHARKLGVEPRDQTLGIVGFGAVGSLLGAYAQQLGMRVMANDPPLQAAGSSAAYAAVHAELDQLCLECDVLTTHTPLTHEGPYPTMDLIATEELELLKERALIVHASRGGVINERALLDCLLNKALGLAIDVWRHEPLANVMLARMAFPATPHIAGYTLDAKIEASRMVVAALANHFGLEARIQTFDLPPNDINVDLRRSQEIYQVLDKSRRLAEDTNHFRKSLYANDGRRAEAFERIRRQYTLRREALRRPDL